MKLTREKLKKIIKEEMSAMGRPWDDWTEREQANIDKGWASARKGAEDREREQRTIMGMAKAARQAVQRILMMDEALPGEDKWLEDKFAEVIAEYRREWGS